MKMMKMVASLTVVGLLLAGCGTKSEESKESTKKTEPKQEEVKKDLLTVAMTADNGTLDPAITMDNSAWKITYPTYERLVEYVPGSTEVEPGLAKSWEVSEDGLTWTFSLEEGHKFADGTEVNAEAVKFTIDRILKIAKGPVDVFGVIKEVQVKDPMTVVFILNKNFPPFLSTLAANYGGIVNPKVMEKEVSGDLGQSYLAENTMGSGAYQLTEWKKGEYVKLEKNPNTKEAVNFNTVYFKIVADASAQSLQLQKGEIDVAEGIPIEQLESVQKADNVQVFQNPSLLVDYVYINTSKGNKALENPKVRQALSYAIDYDALIQGVQQGYATQMQGPIPKGLWGHDESALQYKRDVEKAKGLLEEAGVKDLTLKLVYSDRSSWWEAEALTLQANLADIGVNLELNKVAYTVQREMIDAGNFDLCLGLWSPDFADPFMFMNYWFDSNNFGLSGNRAFYKNDQVDQLVRDAATTNNQDERVKMYKEAQGIILEDAPYLFLYQKDALLVASKSLKGYQYNPMLEGIYNLTNMSKE